MKKKTLAAIWVACALLVTGIVLGIMTLAIGAEPLELFTNGTYTFDADSLDVVEEYFGDDRHGFSGERGDSGFASRPDVEAELIGGENHYTVADGIDSVKVGWVSGLVRIV